MYVQTMVTIGTSNKITFWKKEEESETVISNYMVQFGTDCELHVRTDDGRQHISFGFFFFSALLFLFFFIHRAALVYQYYTKKKTENNCMMRLHHFISS